MKPKLNEDDAHLFREAVRDVKPLTPGAPVPETPRPPPRARFTRADRRAVLQESLETDVGDPELASGEELVFARDGVQSGVLRKLRRGQYRVQAEIDLHGFRTDEAREALAEFLREAVKQGWRCVRVVHGKGLGSPGKTPVLKGKVHSWLVQKNEVLAFVQARGDEGGAGAVVVLLTPS